MPTLVSLRTFFLFAAMSGGLACSSPVKEAPSVGSNQAPSEADSGFVAPPRPLRKTPLGGRPVRLNLPEPVRFTERVGIYHWGGDPTPAMGANFLNWGANQIADLGSETIRIPLLANDDFPLLSDLANKEEYIELFSNPRLKTFLITAFTGGSASINDGYDAQEMAQEENAFFNLALALGTQYPTKKFIFLNWEGDWSLLQNDANDPRSQGANSWHAPAAEDPRWDGMINWLTARARGVHRAGDVLKARNRLLSGLEYVAVADMDDHVTPCSEEKGFDACVISYVAPRVEVDVYSFSSWQTVPRLANDPLAMKKALDFSFEAVKKLRPLVTKEQFILGELGNPRDIPNGGDCASMTLVQKALESGLDWGVRYAIFWQIVDHRPVGQAFGGPFIGYGVIRRDGSRTLSGELLKESLRLSRVVSVMPANCPTLTPQGVVNAASGVSDFKLNSVLSLYGQHFSSTGNVVRLLQGEKTFDISTGYACSQFPQSQRTDCFFESPTQINVALPDGLSVSQPVYLYVSRKDNLDSGSVPLTLSAP